MTLAVRPTAVRAEPGQSRRIGDVMLKLDNVSLSKSKRLVPPALMAVDMSIVPWFPPP